jgi:hypothetical protein
VGRARPFKLGVRSARPGRRSRQQRRLQPGAQPRAGGPLHPGAIEQIGGARSFARLVSTPECSCLVAVSIDRCPAAGIWVLM